MKNENDAIRNRNQTPGLGPRNDVLTTCKAVTQRAGQRIITVFFPAVNIFRLFKSKKRTDTGNQKCLKSWKKSCHASLFFLHIVFVFRYWNAGETKTQSCYILTNNNVLGGFIYRLRRFCRARITWCWYKKSTGAIVKFIGSKYIQESFIKMSLLLYIS